MMCAQYNFLDLSTYKCIWSKFCVLCLEWLIGKQYHQVVNYMDRYYRSN